MGRNCGYRSSADVYAEHLNSGDALTLRARRFPHLIRRRPRMCRSRSTRTRSRTGRRPVPRLCTTCRCSGLQPRPRGGCARRPRHRCRRHRQQVLLAARLPFRVLWLPAQSSSNPARSSRRWKNEPWQTRVCVPPAAVPGGDLSAGLSPPSSSRGQAAVGCSNAARSGGVGIGCRRPTRARPVLPSG